MRSLDNPQETWTLSISAFRLEDGRGSPIGVATIFTDVTAQELEQRHSYLRHEATVRIGGSLDITRTAQDLSDMLVPAFGNVSTVVLAEAVLEGNEPRKVTGGGDQHLHRIAISAPAPHEPKDLPPVGTPLPPFPDSDVLRRLQQGKTCMLRDPGAMASLFGDSKLTNAAGPARATPW